MKIVHTSDVHLGRFYKGELPTEIAKLRREEIWTTFENLIEYIRTNDVEVLLISGDLYEKEYFSAKDAKRLIDVLNRIKNTEIFIINGNHDFRDEDFYFNSQNISSNIYFLNSNDYVQIDSLNLRVYGKSWEEEIGYTSELNFNLDENYYNILLLHGTVGGNSYFPIKIKDISDLKFDYIALGHIHKNQKILDNCYYSGSLEPLSFKDSGEHGFNLINLERNIKNIEMVNFSKRKYNTFELNITEDMDLYSVEEEIKKLLKGFEIDFNRILLKGEFGDSQDLVENLINRNNYFYTEYVNCLTEVIDVELLYNLNKNNILGSVINELKFDEEAMKYAIKALMEAENEYN